MICSKCGSEVDDPPILESLRKGYNPDSDCRIQATVFGNKEVCLNWMNYTYCETCPRSKEIFKKKVRK